jgi:hypothetical protein
VSFAPRTFTLPPLTHRITEAMPAWGLALGPIVEHVARTLSTSSPYDVSVPSVLTRDKHKAALRVVIQRNTRSQ